MTPSLVEAHARVRPLRLAPSLSSALDTLWFTYQHDRPLRPLTRGLFLLGYVHPDPRGELVCEYVRCILLEQAYCVAGATAPHGSWQEGTLAGRRTWRAFDLDDSRAHFLITELQSRSAS